MLHNRLPAMAAQAVPMIEAALSKTAFETERLAKSAAPIDTGNLRNSIETRPVMPLTWRVTANADYSLFVEMGWQQGTNRHAGTFFLANSLKRSWASTTRVLGDAFGGLGR